jgi:hypothetical protein
MRPRLMALAALAAVAVIAAGVAYAAAGPSVTINDPTAGQRVSAHKNP